MGAEKPIKSVAIIGAGASGKSRIKLSIRELNYVCDGTWG